MFINREILNHLYPSRAYIERIISMNYFLKNRAKIYDILHITAVGFCAVATVGLGGCLAVGFHQFKTSEFF